MYIHITQGHDNAAHVSVRSGQDGVRTETLVSVHAKSMSESDFIKAAWEALNKLFPYPPYTPCITLKPAKRMVMLADDGSPRLATWAQADDAYKRLWQFEDASALAIM